MALRHCCESAQVVQLAPYAPQARADCASCVTQRALESQQPPQVAGEHSGPVGQENISPDASERKATRRHIAQS